MQPDTDILYNAMLSVRHTGRSRTLPASDLKNNGI